jgi:hypothetical protein
LPELEGARVRDGNTTPAGTVSVSKEPSRRVLEECGFRLVATERSFAEARSVEIEESVLRFGDASEA